MKKRVKKRMAPSAGRTFRCTFRWHLLPAYTFQTEMGAHRGAPPQTAGKARLDDDLGDLTGFTP